MAVSINNTELNRTASEFVNNIFYGTLLRQFRDAQKPSIFGQGPGGATFLRMLDTELIKRMSQRGVSPVAEAVSNHLSKMHNQTLTLPNAESQATTTSACDFRRTYLGQNHAG